MHLSYNLWSLPITNAMTCETSPAQEDNSAHKSFQPHAYEALDTACTAASAPNLALTQALCLQKVTGMRMPVSWTLKR